MIDFKDQYAVFGCVKTLRLYQEFGGCSGPLRPFVPIERVRTIDAHTHMETVKTYPAMTGLIFIPISNAPEFRRRVSEFYHARQLYTPQRRGPTPRDQPIPLRPQIADFKRLLGMQELLNQEFDGGDVEVEDIEWFAKGDRVLVHDHPLFDKPPMATVVKMRADGRARLRVDGDVNFHVEISKTFLTKIPTE